MKRGTTFQTGKSQIHRPKREWCAFRRTKTNQEQPQNMDPRLNPEIVSPKGKNRRPDNAS